MQRGEVVQAFVPLLGLCVSVPMTVGKAPGDDKCAGCGGKNTAVRAKRAKPPLRRSCPRHPAAPPARSSASTSCLPSLPASPPSALPLPSCNRFFGTSQNIKQLRSVAVQLVAISTPANLRNSHVILWLLLRAFPLSQINGHSCCTVKMKCVLVERRGAHTCESTSRYNLPIRGSSELAAEVLQEADG